MTARQSRVSPSQILTAPSCSSQRHSSGNPFQPAIRTGTAKNLVGEQVRALRIKRGMSQQALSDKLETMAIYVCRGSVSRIEDRQRTVTDIELYGLSQVLGVPISQLFGPDEQ